MKILSKINDGLKRCYTVCVSAEEVENSIVEKLKEVSKKVRLDGFRPGKVPLDVLRRLYGDNVKDEAVEGLLSDTAKKIFKDENIKVSFNFSTDILKRDDSGIEFSLKFEIVPEIELQDFSSIELVKHVPTITEKETMHILDDIRENHKNWIEEPDGTKAANGHKVVVDLLVKTKSKKQKDAPVNDVDIIIGDEKIIEDFWKPMLDIKVSEVKEFSVAYPDNMRDKGLSGKTMDYIATVKKIMRATEYELDDTFAKSLGYEDFNALHTWAESRAVAEYDNTSKDLLKRDLLEKLSLIYSFEVPKNMLDIETIEVKRQIGEEAERLGKEMTQELEDECVKIAERRVRLGFVVAEISKKEKIMVSSAEIGKAIRNIAMMYPGREKMVVDMYSRKEAMNAIAGPILEAKIVDFLLGIVKITEESCSVKELIDLDEEPFDFFKEDALKDIEKVTSQEKDVETEVANAAEEKVEKKTTKKTAKSESDESNKELDAESKSSESVKKSRKKKDSE